MADAGQKSNNLDLASGLDNVLGHRDGSLVQVDMVSVGAQLAGAGPVAAAMEELRSQITSGGIGANAWSVLQTYAGAVDGAGAEVLDTDLGTHSQASATGYDGATVPNAGRYTWSATWGRWVRIGATGLSGKAPIASPVFTGVPQAPTAAPGTDTTQLATTAFVQAAAQAAIDALAAAAPGQLDTLQELSAALANDPNFAATVTASLATKAPLASPALTGTPTAPTAAPGTGTTQIATTAFVQAAAQTAIDALVAAAPGQLDTLQELSA
ncbi:MAG: hypothetical protein AB7S99_06495, partial [Pseudodonghicola sp.]